MSAAVSAAGHLVARAPAPAKAAAGGGGGAWLSLDKSHVRPLSPTMSRQDKATTEKHAKTLRELVRRPDNKVCADCKHNDPRWASWNL